MSLEIAQFLINQCGMADLQSNVLRFNGQDPIFDSQFFIADAAAGALAANASLAANIGALRGGPEQEIDVDVAAAGASLLSFMWQKLESAETPQREMERPLVQMYPCADGSWVHLHGAFPKLAEGTLAVLQCAHDKQAIAAAVAKRNGQELEDALAGAGLCGAKVRSPQQWQATGQGQAVANTPLIEITKIAQTPPQPFPVDSHLGSRPLSKIKVLDLTRVLAGPTCARTLASHGAQVLKINSPNLPSVEPFVMDTGHGKRSAFIDLELPEQRLQLRQLVQDCDVFSQGYRLGSLAGRGFGSLQLAQQMAEQDRGLVYVSINCYGHSGPWAARPGWEQLAQCVTGMAQVQGSAQLPQLQPAAVCDYVTGYLASLGTMAALILRATQGGSYEVKVSLARTAMWLQQLGHAQGEPAGLPDISAFMQRSESGFGLLNHLGPVVKMSATPPAWQQGSVPLGSHPALWW